MTDQKTILLTGSTDGIGLEAARMLVSQGHRVLLHGRNSTKLKAVHEQLSALPNSAGLELYQAELSSMEAVEALAEEVARKHARLDVLINNAGVFKLPNPVTRGGIDARFAVNTLAPYLLTQRLLPLLGSGRVVNLSSAAQAPVDLEALAGRTRLSDSAAYAQSKLALTMWSRGLALSLEGRGPVVIAVNPGSFLGSKLVKQAYGLEGSDLNLGAAVVCRAALSDDFAAASGQYFDNDSGQFASPHPDVGDQAKRRGLMALLESLLQSAPSDEH